MKSNVVIAVLAVLVAANGTLSYAQRCGNTSTGLVPLNDLGPGFYRGMQGGLYPGGQNDPPWGHLADGIQLSGNVAPLDLAGNPDPVSGRIVLLSIGMSNSHFEFEVLQTMFDTLASKNPFLELVNGAQSNMDIDTIVNGSTRYWEVISDSLKSRGLSEQQVQAIWFKQAEAFPGLEGEDTTFAPYVEGLSGKFAIAMNIIRDHYPNAMLGYIASRIYAGYATTRLNPEPLAYYTGWAGKLVIENQINGDPSLSYSGPDPVAPWLSWGVYLWADGLAGRSDGLQWICPDDYMEDGTHPSDPVGREKVAGLLLDFFKSDATTRDWFLAGQAPVVSDIPGQTIPPGGRFKPVRLDNYVTDPDDPDSLLSWSWTGNSDLTVSWDPVRRGVRIRSPENWEGSETIVFTATDPGGRSDSDGATFAVIPSTGIGETKDFGLQRENNGDPGTEFLGSFPNPFNPTTTISYRLGERLFVDLKIFDTAGREVRVVVNETEEPGSYEVRPDFSGLASGVYIYRFHAGGLVQTGKIVLLR